MKNKKIILKFAIFSIVFVSILGTLLHFTFEWSNGNVLVGAFSAVNESTWEHLKLIFYPMLITTIIGYPYLTKNIPSFLCARLFGIIVSMAFIVIFFYTSTGIIGTNIAILNVGSFFVSVLLGEYISYKLMISNFNCSSLNAIVTLAILLFSFVFFTYFPPKIGLFKDPVSNGYGIVRTN